MRHRVAMKCSRIRRSDVESSQPVFTIERESILVTSITRTQERVTRPVMFMFPGQGSQHPGMAASLYRGESVFRQEADRCLELLVMSLVAMTTTILHGCENEGGRTRSRIQPPEEGGHRTAAVPPGQWLVHVVSQRVGLRDQQRGVAPISR